MSTYLIEKNNIHNIPGQFVNTSQVLKSEKTNGISCEFKFYHEKKKLKKIMLPITNAPP